MSETPIYDAMRAERDNQWWLAKALWSRAVDRSGFDPVFISAMSMAGMWSMPDWAKFISDGQ
jgi:hypothetical protein